MKRFVAIIMISLLMVSGLIAKTYTVSAVKNNSSSTAVVKVETPDGEITELSEGDTIDDEDILHIPDRCSVVFYVDNQKVLIKGTAIIKVKDSF